MISLRRTYQRIWEMIEEVLLLPETVEAMIRKSMARMGASQGAEEVEIPDGGLKGWALVKKSNADYDAEWQPHGPYIYDFGQYSPLGSQWKTWLPWSQNQPASTYPWSIGVTPDRVKDAVPFFPPEPVPVVSQSFAHINLPLRSGVSPPAGFRGFDFDNWEQVLGVGGFPSGPTKSYAKKKTTPLTPTAPAAGEAALVGTTLAGSDKAYIMQGSERAFRVQLYLTRCSSQVFVQIAAPGYGWWDGVAQTAANMFVFFKRLYPGGPGYFDSGWIEWVPANRTGFGLGTGKEMGGIFIGDTVDTDISLAFAEMQVRLYEHKDWLDYLSAEGPLPT